MISINFALIILSCTKRFIFSSFHCQFKKKTNQKQKYLVSFEKFFSNALFVIIKYRVIFSTKERILEIKIYFSEPNRKGLLGVQFKRGFWQIKEKILQGSYFHQKSLFSFSFVIFLSSK
jgi:hypothetical protein